MKQPKLVQIFKKFSKAELTALEKHMNSLHQAGSDDYRIFKALQKQILKAPQKLDVENIKKKQFPQMTDKGFSNMLSRVGIQVEDWLVSYDISQSKCERELQLVRSYNQRGLYQLATKLYRKLEKRWTEDTKLDLNDQKYLAQLYHHQYYSDNPIKYEEGTQLLEKLVRSSFTHFAEQGQFYQNEMFSWGRIRSYDYSELLSDYDAIRNTLPVSTISKVGNSLYEALKNDQLSEFESVVGRLLNGDFKSDTELHSLIGLYSISCALRFWRIGILKEPDLISELYNHCLTAGVLLQNGKIPRIRFLNIVGTLGTIRSYDYMCDFINEWIAYIETNHVDSVYALAMAENCFVHQEYDKILPYVRDVTYEDIDSRTRAMCYSCVAMFEDETCDEEVLYTQIHNHRRFFRRHSHELSVAAYEGRSNFLTVLILLTKRRYKSIDIDLSVYKHLHYRTWISSHL